MQKLIFLLVTVLLCSSLHAQDSSCNIYHKGFFSYTDSLGRTVLVDRQKRYQYEKNIVTKVKTQFRITWTGECSYTILQTLTNSKAAKKYKYSSSSVIISNPHGNEGYDYSCACPDPSKGKGYMKKITKKEYYALF
jgi:hypothetical protein